MPRLDLGGLGGGQSIGPGFSNVTQVDGQKSKGLNLSEEKKLFISNGGHGSPESVESRAARLAEIDEFSGYYEFLALSSLHEVWFRGELFETAEEAWWWAHYALRVEPGDTKHVKSRIVNREVGVGHGAAADLVTILRDKFVRHQELRKLLVDTGTRGLVWKNHYDEHLGMIGSHGQNVLGRTLQDIRFSIRHNSDIGEWLMAQCLVVTDEILFPHMTVKGYKPGNSDIAKETMDLDKKAFYSVGKLPSNDVVALHPSISRTHALLSANPDGDVYVIDTNSKLGVYVNGIKIERSFMPKILKKRDKIKFGESTRWYTVTLDLKKILDYYNRQKQQVDEQLFRINEELENPASRDAIDIYTVEVSGLGPKTTVHDLEDFFAVCGSIANIAMDRAKPSREPSLKLRSANITFRSSAASRQAIMREGLSIKGYKIALRSIRFPVKRIRED